MVIAQIVETLLVRIGCYEFKKWLDFYIVCMLSLISCITI